jgi:hypothetical protein
VSNAFFSFFRSAIEARSFHYSCYLATHSLPNVPILVIWGVPEGATSAGVVPQYEIGGSIGSPDSILNRRLYEVPIMMWSANLRGLSYKTPRRGECRVLAQPKVEV